MLFALKTTACRLCLHTQTQPVRSLQQVQGAERTLSFFVHRIERNPAEHSMTTMLRRSILEAPELLCFVIKRLCSFYAREDEISAFVLVALYSTGRRTKRKQQTSGAGTATNMPMALLRHVHVSSAHAPSATAPFFFFNFPQFANTLTHTHTHTRSHFSHHRFTFCHSHPNPSITPSIKA